MSRRRIVACALAGALGVAACSAGTTSGAPATPASSTASPATTPGATTAASPATTPGATNPGAPAVASTTAAATIGVGPASSAAAPPGPDRPCGGPGTPPATYDHVIWIWMENHRAAQVLGAGVAPVLDALAARCGGAGDYRAVGSPSLPNYLGATSGDTWGIADDADPARHPLDVDNLFRQVRRSGRSAVSYVDAMPGPCALTGRGTYAVRHNPAAYYVGADDRAACANDDVPLGTIDAGALHDALAQDALPAFAFVTPDLCHDTHDCAVADGDAWLGPWLAAVLGSRAYASGRTAVFVAWDEPTPMPFLAVAPTIPAGATVPGAVDHYALLRTTEELLGIDAHLGHAATAPSLRAALGL